MTKYCPSCGFPTPYSLSLPKFCSGCGASFVVQGSVKPPVVLATRPQPSRQIFETEVEQETSSPVDFALKKFELDFRVNIDKPESLDRVVAMGPQGIEERDPGKKLSRKQLKEQSHNLLSSVSKVNRQELGS